MFTEGSISKELRENLQRLDGIFENCMDYLCKRFQIGETEAALLTVDGLVDKQTVAQSVMNPIRSAVYPKLQGAPLLEYIGARVLASAEQIPVNGFSALQDLLLGGFAVILLDGCTVGMGIGAQGFACRSVSEPDNEAAQRGSKEGFVEPYQMNAAMIRRRLRTPQLKFERMVIGAESNTSVAVCYLKDVVSQKLLEDVKDALGKIRIQTVLASGYLSPFLERGGILNGVGYTERPDTVCGKLSEGRIGIIVDGTPNVLIVPFLFVENFQSFDDYVNRPFFASFTRWLKYLAALVSVYLPCLYVSAVMYYPELLPDRLLEKVAADERATPFSVFAETVLILLLYETMREAGLRVQKPLGGTVSIVGGFVVGEAAVKAGIVGSLTLMIVAMATLASFATPKLYETAGAIRLILLLAGAALGLWGIVTVSAALLISVCGKSAFGVPFTAPLSPFSLFSMRDVLIRADWKKLARVSNRIQDMPGSDLEKKR